MENEFFGSQYAYTFALKSDFENKISKGFYFKLDSSQVYGKGMFTFASLSPLKTLYELENYIGREKCFLLAIDLSKYSDSRIDLNNSYVDIPGGIHKRDIHVVDSLEKFLEFCCEPKSFEWMMKRNSVLSINDVYSMNLFELSPVLEKI